MTPVIFRRWTGTDDIFAVFPTQPARGRGQMLGRTPKGPRTVYYGSMMRESVPAKPTEYAPLLQILQGEGMGLCIILRKHAGHDRVRRLARLARTTKN